jgi:hypothetical protein
VAFCNKRVMEKVIGEIFPSRGAVYSLAGGSSSKSWVTVRCFVRVFTIPARLFAAATGLRALHMGASASALGYTPMHGAAASRPEGQVVVNNHSSTVLPLLRDRHSLIIAGAAD